MTEERQLRVVGGTTAPKDGNQTTLPPGGGNGGMDDMEARLKRLEDDARESRADLKSIRIDLAEIKGKLSSMPSTWQIMGICAGLIGIVIASGGGLLAIIRFMSPSQ